MRRLVADTGVLDLNSTYTYLLMATDFAATSIVADRDGDLCGLVTGYHPPTRPEVLFVWQVAVAVAAREPAWPARCSTHWCAASDTAGTAVPLPSKPLWRRAIRGSRALFGAFARRRGVPMFEEPCFSAEHLDVHQNHGDEPLLRIRPIAAPLTD